MSAWQRYLMLLSIFAAGIDSVCAQSPVAVEQAVIEEVANGLKSKAALIFRRVTSEGELSACELEFETSLRDYRANQGKPIVVMGAVSSMYSKGKYPSLSLKVKTHLLDFGGSSPWRPVQPAFADVVISKFRMKPYKVVAFECEGGGLCQAFSDSKLAPYIAILDSPRLDIEVQFSLAKGGMDHSFKLSYVGPEKDSRAALDAFQHCTSEVLTKTANDLKVARK